MIYVRFSGLVEVLFEMEQIQLKFAQQMQSVHLWQLKNSPIKTHTQFKMASFFYTMQLQLKSWCDKSRVCSFGDCKCHKKRTSVSRTNSECSILETPNPNNTPKGKVKLTFSMCQIFEICSFLEIPDIAIQLIKIILLIRFSYKLLN